MRRPARVRRRVDCVALWLVLTQLAHSIAAQVVLEQVTELGALARSGLEPGDVVHSCRSDQMAIAVAVPIDLKICEWELSPRREPTVLEIERAGVGKSFVSVAPGLWRARSRPVLEERRIRLFERGRRELDAGEDYAAGWQELERELLARGEAELAFWLFVDRHDQVHSEPPQHLWQDIAERRGFSSETFFPNGPIHQLARFSAERARRAAQGEVEEVVRATDQALQAVRRLEKRPLTELRWRLALAQSLYGNAEHDRSSLLLRGLLEDLRGGGYTPSVLQGSALVWLSHSALARQELVEAEAALRAAVPVLEQVDSDHYSHAGARIALGLLHSTRGNKTAARDLALEAAEIHQRRGYESWQPFLNAGLAAESLGDYQEAVEFLDEALRLAPPESLAAALVQGQLGFTYISWWKLDEAEKHSRSSHQLFERLDHRGQGLAKSHARLGHVERYRGDLAGAERHYLKAMQIYRKAGDLAGVAAHLSNLGNLARQRNDYEGALIRYREALDHQALRPSAGYLGRTLSNVGRTLLLLQRPEEAVEPLQQALQIKLREASESQDVAASLMLLGDLERSLGNADAAGASYRRALAIHTRLTPERPPEAENQVRLAQLELDVGRPAAAEELLAAATKTLSLRAPATTLAADAFYHHGRLLEARGDFAEALASYRQAIEALDEQWVSLGGSPDTELSWMHAHADYYRAYIRLLVSTGSKELAFEVLQRARSRVLRKILDQRKLRRDLSPESAAIDQQLQELSRQRQDVLSRLRQVNDVGQTDELRGRLTALRTRREELQSAISASASDTTSMQQIQQGSERPLRDLQTALPMGTLLVSFSVGEESTLVFAARRKKERLWLEVAHLDVARSAIHGLVDEFRQAIRNREAVEGRITPLGARLYELLFAPFADEMKSANQLLVIPDGPLHHLPFAALRSRGNYLVEEMPLHVAPSFEVFARLDRRSANRGRSAALGDPSFATSDGSRAALRPLPGARHEVQQIAEVLPQPAAIFLGDRATETVAKGLSQEQIVHFASHAVLDENIPLNSAIALGEATPAMTAEVEDGWLHAWEVIEGLRLPASLVTLSACETALGKESKGEGLLGLVWAFHLAGAKSVLASLWSVGDASTAVLMSRFYKELEVGADKARALRHAQLSFIRSTEDAHPGLAKAHAARAVGGLRAANLTMAISHPYHWAAFQMYGSSRP